MPRFSSEDHRLRCTQQLDAAMSYFRQDWSRWDRVYPLLAKKEGKSDKQQTQTQQLSFRLLDFLVTTYSRLHVCQYTVREDDGHTRLVNIRHSAQTLLSALHKRSLDPFRRVNKCMKDGGLLEFGYGDKVVKTTMAQLMFFRWALYDRVLDYAQAHLEEIRTAMAEHANRKRLSSAIATDFDPAHWPAEIVLEFASSTTTTTVPRKRQKSTHAAAPVVINAFIEESAVFVADAAAS
jgi:hypothetical protein